MAGDDHRWLKYCALFYALGLGLHTADHLRRGLDAVTPQVLWLGNVSTVAGIAVATLVVVGYRNAPLLAAVTGIPVAVGVAAVHLLPKWSAFSDAFVGAHDTGVTAVVVDRRPHRDRGRARDGIAGVSIVRSARERVAAV